MEKTFRFKAKTANTYNDGVRGFSVVRGYLYLAGIFFFGFLLLTEITQLFLLPVLIGVMVLIGALLIFSGVRNFMINEEKDFDDDMLEKEGERYLSLTGSFMVREIADKMHEVWGVDPITDILLSDDGSVPPIDIAFVNKKGIFLFDVDKRDLTKEELPKYLNEMDEDEFEKAFTYSGDLEGKWENYNNPSLVTDTPVQENKLRIDALKKIFGDMDDRHYWNNVILKKHFSFDDHYGHVSRHGTKAAWCSDERCGIMTTAIAPFEHEMTTWETGLESWSGVPYTACPFFDRNHADVYTASQVKDIENKLKHLAAGSTVSSVQKTKTGNIEEKEPDTTDVLAEMVNELKEKETLIKDPSIRASLDTVLSSMEETSFWVRS